MWLDGLSKGFARASFCFGALCVVVYGFLKSCLRDLEARLAMQTTEQRSAP